MPKIKILPSEEILDVAEGEILLDCLKKQNVYVKSSCGGVASCGDCVVKIVSGQDNLTMPEFSEIKLLGNVFHITKERLSCQTRVLGDLVLDLTNQDKAKDEARLKNKTNNLKKKNGPVLKKKEKVMQDREERFANRTPRPTDKDSGFKKPKKSFRYDKKSE